MAETKSSLRAKLLGNGLVIPVSKAKPICSVSISINTEHGWDLEEKEFETELKNAIFKVLDWCEAHKAKIAQIKLIANQDIFNWRLIIHASFFFTKKEDAMLYVLANGGHYRDEAAN